MKRYIAFLRGVNISGKNKVPMAELKQGFERLDYTDVKTYLNSGNVIFSSDEADTIKTTSRIEEMIKDQFCLDIPTVDLVFLFLFAAICACKGWQSNDYSKHSVRSCFYGTNLCCICWIWNTGRNC